MADQWPEPLVPVQSISESGATFVPDRYIKPPDHRPTTELAAAVTIPTIDLAGLASTPAKCRATIEEVSRACKEWGFFQLLNHGVELDLMERVLEVWRRFFRLSAEEKQKFANSPINYEGYGSRVGVEEGAILDWGDYYFLQLFPSGDVSKWSCLSPSCKSTVEEYGGETARLCRTLLTVLSVGLGLEPDHLYRATGGDEAGRNMRVNYYPKCPQPDLTLGLSTHSDPGVLTVLLPDGRVDGLQICKDGRWTTVRTAPNALIINVGDQIQVLSNGIYKSSEHRAIVNSEMERLSIALFYNPKGDIPIAPAEELISETMGRPTLYSPMTYNEYRLFIRLKGPKGKLQLESMKMA